MSEEDVRHAEEWVALPSDRAFDQTRAELLVQVLEAEGVPARLAGPATTLFGAFARRGFTVLVPPPKLAEAREVMAAYGFGAEGETPAADE